MKEHGNQLQEISKRLEELENQKAKNSKNSHQPPSGDGFGKQTKSLRKKSERKVIMTVGQMQSSFITKFEIGPYGIIS